MTDWITGLIERMGYLGIALLMFLENLFPPLPSEVIMPMAGFTAAGAELNIVGVLAAGIAGTLAGALFWYGVAKRLGEERLKRWADRHGRWIRSHAMISKISTSGSTSIVAGQCRLDILSRASAR
jgi:membrane protein DedA with SNARE-associated domain